MIVIGTDTRKKTHTCAAVDALTARARGELTSPARKGSFGKLLVWARALDPERVWAIEDCRHVSGALERFLVARGERIVRVAPKVHALLARQGIGNDHADLFGSAGKATLAQLPLRPEPRQRLEVLLRLIGDFDREIDALAKQIHRLAQHDPRVAVLTQLRGIGRYIAMLIIAEVGEVERFPSARHLCAWAGLTPTVRSSDGKARLGHISRLGSSTLRWALVEAAQHTRRRRRSPSRPAPRRRVRR